MSSAVPARYGHAEAVSAAPTPEYLVLAYLRDGRYRCVEAALAVLHATGHIKAGRRGTVARADATTPPPEGVEHVIWQGVHGHVAPGALVATGPVDAGLSALRRELRRQGLIRASIPVRSWLPSRTRKGRQALRRGAHACPAVPTDPVDLPVSDPRTSVGMPVALYGSAALANLLPRFADDSGLLIKSSSDSTLADANSPHDRTDYAPGM